MTTLLTNKPDIMQSVDSTRVLLPETNHVSIKKILPQTQTLHPEIVCHVRPDIVYFFLFQSWGIKLATLSIKEKIFNLPTLIPINSQMSFLKEQIFLACAIMDIECFFELNHFDKLQLLFGFCFWKYSLLEETEKQIREKYNIYKDRYNEINNELQKIEHSSNVAYRYCLEKQHLVKQCLIENGMKQNKNLRNTGDEESLIDVLDFYRRQKENKLYDFR